MSLGALFIVYYRDSIPCVGFELTFIIDDTQYIAIRTVQPLQSTVHFVRWNIKVKSIANSISVKGVKMK